MKIKIIDKEHNFFLCLPTRLFLNGLFASLVPIFVNAELKKYGMRVTGHICRKFVREFYRTRKHFGGKLELIEAESKDGGKVKITL